MTRDDTTSIHRYLDGVFEGIPLTPDVQDLKEELRGNLTARVTELEAGGLEAAAASRKAIKELGDVREILTQLGVDSRTTPSARSGKTTTDARPADSGVGALHVGPRVRLRPAFVVRTVGLSLAAAIGLVLVILAIVGRDESRWCADPIVASCVLALPLGLIVADSLRQETTVNHPLPFWRSAGYGLATAMTVGGAGLLAVFLGRTSETWLAIAGGTTVVVAVCLFSYLGASQTNRKKAWARQLEPDIEDVVQDRLQSDPAAAARFGLYSGVLWIGAIGAFVVVSITNGFRWSWLAFLAALLIQLILVARMAIPTGAPGRTKES